MGNLKCGVGLGMRVAVRRKNITPHQSLRASFPSRGSQPVYTVIRMTRMKRSRNGNFPFLLLRYFVISNLLSLNSTVMLSPLFTVPSSIFSASISSISD